MNLKNLFTTSFISLLLVGSTKADGLYAKGSSVLQVNGKSYDKLIAKSSQVTVSI